MNYTLKQLQDKLNRMIADHKLVNHRPAWKRGLEWKFAGKDGTLNKTGLQYIGTQIARRIGMGPNWSAFWRNLGLPEEFITFLGRYDQTNAEKIYQMADAYITMSYQDNCPSAVIEAMSCGLPILYSASGGIPELVGSDSGVGLEVPCDWEKIHLPKVEKIVEGFLKLHEDRKIMSEAARIRAVELFDIEKWHRKHLEIFECNLRNI